MFVLLPTFFQLGQSLIALERAAGSTGVSACGFHNVVDGGEGAFTGASQSETPTMCQQQVAVLLFAACTQRAPNLIREVMGQAPKILCFAPICHALTSAATMQPDMFETRFM